jgi:uncharacterized protein (TIGR03545 family)
MKEEKAKSEKPAKVPGKLKKPIKEKAFQKRFLKLIEQADDRDWFASQFELKEGAYRLREGIGKSDAKRLANLAGVIQGNRKGPLSLAPLALAGVVVGGIVVFFVVFANPLLERAMEMGLEAIFEAKSDVDRLRLSLFRFSISIDGITVANRDKPMTNLFQMGKTRIKLLPQAVLRGKVYIEEVRADTIRFGTERKVSGALPNRPPRAKKEKQKSDEPPLIDLQNFDAMGLLNREFDKLNTPKLYDTAIAAYNEALEKWQGQIDLAKARTEELKTAAQPIVNFNVNSFTVRDIRDAQAIRETVENINKMINDVNTMATTVQTAAADATGMIRSLGDDIDTARGLEQSARTAIADDINHLRSYIDLGSGSAFAALEPSVREILSDAGEQYLDYGLRALEALEKLKAMQAARPKTEKPKKEPRVVFRGRDVAYPTRAYPAFYLGVLASDFTIDPWNWAFDMRDISSDPDLTNRPVTLKLGAREEAGSLRRQVAFDGSADFRTVTADRFAAAVSGDGFPVSLGDALSKVGVNGFRGETAFSVNLTGHTDGGVSGGGDVMIANAQLVEPQGTIAQALDAAVREAENISLGIQYTHHVDEKDEFHITTNIAELMAQALRRIVNEYARRAMDEIERALRERISQYIDGRFVSSQELDTLFAVARGDVAARNELRNILNNKKTELEAKAREFTDQTKAVAEQAAQEVKDEATRQGQQAIQDALQGQQPTLQAPSLPSLPSLPSTGGGIRLPGR